MFKADSTHNSINIWLMAIISDISQTVFFFLLHQNRQCPRLFLSRLLPGRPNHLHVERLLFRSNQLTSPGCQGKPFRVSCWQKERESWTYSYTHGRWEYWHWDLLFLILFYQINISPQWVLMGHPSTLIPSCPLTAWLSLPLISSDGLPVIIFNFTSFTGKNFMLANTYPKMSIIFFANGLTTL